MQTSGAMRREIAKPYPRHCEERKRRSNPRLHMPRYGLLRSARNDGGQSPAPTPLGSHTPPPDLFVVEPFPLRPKRLYGAARFAFGEIEFMINIKGFA